MYRYLIKNLKALQPDVNDDIIIMARYDNTLKVDTMAVHRFTFIINVVFFVLHVGIFNYCFIRYVFGVY